MCSTGLLRVKREPSENLGLTRSGKERQDECLVQTLLEKVGSLHLLNVTKPEDLPDSRRNKHSYRVLSAMSAAS